MVIGFLLAAVFLLPSSEDEVQGLSVQAVRRASWWAAVWCAATIALFFLNVSDIFAKPLTDLSSPVHHGLRGHVGRPRSPPAGTGCRVGRHRRSLDARHQGARRDPRTGAGDAGADHPDRPRRVVWLARPRDDQPAPACHRRDAVGRWPRVLGLGGAPRQQTTHAGHRAVLRTGGVGVRHRRRLRRGQRLRAARIVRRGVRLDLRAARAAQGRGSHRARRIRLRPAPPDRGARRRVPPTRD